MSAFVAMELTLRRMRRHILELLSYSRGELLLASRKRKYINSSWLLELETSPLVCHTMSFPRFAYNFS